MATTDVVVVDSNVIIDVVSNDPVWRAWAVGQLGAADLMGPLIANDIVFAEVSSRYDSLDKVHEAFDGMGIRRQPIPPQALFLAGHAFKLYRARRGTKTNVLSDFLIGAHALVLGAPLLTRDERHYRTYFPQLELIVPE